MYPSPIEKGSPAPWMVSESEPLNPRSPILSANARVRVPHKGRMVSGKVVRYDKGGYVPGVRTGGWPFYVVDVGEYESIKVPVDKVIKEAVEVSEAEMTDSQMKRREEIVKSMKDSTQDFKDRYGDRWKEVMYATATKQAMGEAEMISRAISPTPGPEMAEAVQRPVRVGDYVHAGFAVKGGAGFSGRVDKVEGNWVYVNLGKDKSVRFTNDPSSNWGERIIKAPMKNVSLQEESTDSEYEAYFRGMLKKHGYDSPADIPDDKKDDFFNAVDAGYKAKNESALTEAAETFIVMAIDDPSPIWKQGYGHTPQKKVVWQIWGLEKNEIMLAAKMAREKHPKATISVENKSGRIVKVFKPGQAIKEGWASQSSHQYGVTSVDTQEADTHPDSTESDDQDMMSAQLDSLAQKSATIHDILKHVALGDVPAWIQTKVANADKDVSAILDYMKYEEAEPVAEADEKKDAMVPLRMQAAMVIAKSLGSVKGSGQSTDLRVSGGTPESIVNQAIRVWLSGSHTNEGWALGAKMLKLAKSMGIKWDDKLVRQKLAPITLKKLGLDEAEGSGAPSAAEKLRQRQEQEKNALEIRQQREKIAQQQRDANDKMQKQQLKQAERQRTQQQARPAR
jgi:hypothetical protein